MDVGRRPGCNGLTTTRRRRPSRDSRQLHQWSPHDITVPAVTTFHGRRSSGSGSTIQLPGELGSTPRRALTRQGTKSPRAEDLPARERVMRGNEEDPDGRDPVTVSQWKSEGEKWAMQNKRGDGPRVDGKIEMGRVGEKVDPSV